jgi:hypothetical protein
MNYFAPAAIITAVLLGFAGTAEASSWLFIYRTDTGTRVFADADSISRDGDKVSVWFKYDQTNDRTERYPEVKRLYKYDCKARLYWLMSFVQYNARGAVVYQTDYPRMRSSPVVPDSGYEFMMNWACARRSD